MWEISGKVVAHVALVCLIVFYASVLVRKRYAQASSTNPVEAAASRPRLLAAIDAASAAGVALVWIAVSYAKPPLPELWQTTKMHWTAALAATCWSLWLATRLDPNGGAGPELYVRAGLRAALLLAVFAWAIAVILD